jgi:hypothetical protein
VWCWELDRRYRISGRCCHESLFPKPSSAPPIKTRHPPPPRTCAIFCSVEVAASRIDATWSASHFMHWGPSFSCGGDLRCDWMVDLRCEARQCDKDTRPKSHPSNGASRPLRGFATKVPGPASPSPPKKKTPPGRTPPPAAPPAAVCAPGSRGARASGSPRPAPRWPASATGRGGRRR